MHDPMSDDELQLLLPDYLNNTLAPGLRQAVAAYLARNPQARTDCENLQHMLAEMDRIAEAAPEPDDDGLRNFLAHADARPLQRRQAGRSWWARRQAASWWKPAFALAMMVVVGQGALIGHLVRQGGEDGGGSRSLAAPRAQGVVLSVQIAPDASFAQVLAALREVDGKIVHGTGRSPVIQVELSGMPAAAAMRRLKQSDAVLDVIEIPSVQAER